MTIKPFKPRKPDASDGTWRMAQEDVERAQEFRKCIECFLCQDVCHVLRDHHDHDKYIGPAMLVKVAAFEMHPLDVEDRISDLKNEQGIRVLQHYESVVRRFVQSTLRLPTTQSFHLKESVVDEFYRSAHKTLPNF